MAKPAEDRLPPFYLLRRLFQPRELVIVGVLLLEILLFGLKSPAFVTPNLLLGAANYVAIIGVAAIGASMVIIAGGIDLSSGAVYGLCGVCAALWMSDPRHPAPAPAAIGRGRGRRLTLRRAERVRGRLPAHSALYRLLSPSTRARETPCFSRGEERALRSQNRSICS
jgi:hypothetical protein